MRIKLKESDKDILEKLRESIKSDAPIRTYKSKHCFSLLTIVNKNLVGQLLEMGLTNNKSLTVLFPDFLTTELMPHFVRGYFDGDGYIGFDKLENNNQKDNKDKN